MNTDWIIRRIARRNERCRDPAGTYLWGVIATWLACVAVGYWMQWMGWL